VGERAAAVFFIFLREEGLRLRNKNEFRVFFIFRVFCVWLPFSEKLPPCKYFSFFFYMARGSLI